MMYGTRTAYFFIVALALAIAPNAGAEPRAHDRSSYVPPTAELMKKIGPAVVKIVIKQHGVPIETGSGFFISKDGLMVTSRGLLRPVLADADVTAEIVTYDKKIIRDYKVVDCGDLHSSEVCALKLALEPKAIFSFAPEFPLEGEGASMIGHPKGLDFSMTRGLVTKPAKDGVIKTFDVNAPIPRGSSGGPVFDDQGRLLGMASKYSPGQPNRQAVVPLHVFEPLIDSTRLPISLSEARKAAQDALKNEAKKRAAEELDPALGFAARSKSIAGLKGFKDVTLKFDNRLMRLTLPDVFDDCTFTQKTRNTTLYGCNAFGEAATLSIQRMPSKGYEDLLARNGKRLLESKAMPLVEQMVRDEEWEIYEQVLTPEQKRAFFSDPSSAQCQTVRKNTLNSAVFSDIPGCRFSVSNDTEPLGFSINVWLVKDQDLYAIAMWMNDPMLAEYFSRVPSLAILTARWEKSIEPTNTASARVLASDNKADSETKPLPTYKIELPETVSFMGAKITANSAQLDLYGKKLLLDRFEENFVVAVSNQKKSYLPPDFNDVAKKAMGQVARALDAAIQEKTVEIEAIRVGDRPGRLLTAFARDSKGRDVLVLSGAVFYDDQTFELTEISPAKDPAAVFGEFKRLLAGFKRK